jgi:hypothetical protein
MKQKEVKELMKGFEKQLIQGFMIKFDSMGNSYLYHGGEAYSWDNYREYLASLLDKELTDYEAEDIENEFKNAMSLSHVLNAAGRIIEGKSFKNTEEFYDFSFEVTEEE